jgi:aminopeptidase 2
MAYFKLAHSLEVKKETSKLEFHSAELNLGSASLHSDALQTEQIDTSRTYNKEQERTTLHFAKPLPAGTKAQLHIAFDGPLTGSMMGYYKSSYEVDGKTKYYTLTQFEVDACLFSTLCSKLTIG